MMNSKALILAALQASSLFTSTLALCDTECTTKNAAEDFTISYSLRCKPDKFLEKVTDPAVHNCLVCLYNHDRGTSLTDISDVVQELCIEGYAAQEFPYTDIAQRGAQFDNEHYAGGGEWNYEIETASGEDRLKHDASRVYDVYYYEAQRKVIEFPEHITSFNPHTDGKNSFNGIQDLDGCDLNSAFCCFAQDRQAGDNNGNCATPYEYNCVDKDPADNANICYVDHDRSSKSTHVDSGFSIYADPINNKEAIEGPIHCHGFAWSNDPLHPDSVFRGNLLFYVSMYDHMTQRGYVRNIPGSPMCACSENMAVVTRADCTQVSTSEVTYIKWSVATETLEASIDVKDINFNACQGVDANNDLYERLRKLNQLSPEKHVSQKTLDANKEILVGKQAGKCSAAVEAFLGTKNITRITSS